MIGEIGVFGLIVVVIGIFLIANMIRILKEYERGVIFRLGRLIDIKGPGLIILIPVIDQIVKVDLRVVTLDVPPQDIITRDNVSVQVSAVIFFRVMEPKKAVTEVQNYLFATSQFSQTTLRSILGQMELDDLLSEREKINLQLQEVIDRHTGPWGIKVTAVEVKQVDLPQEMKRAMSAQAEAERMRRAKIIAADGEFQASAKLAEAATVISVDPTALQLRYLQTLTEIAAENSSTIIFPLPIELFRAFMPSNKGS
ncbi:MAG: slipin family protein [bacterium]|nr:slipin family protein [bacterium]